MARKMSRASKGRAKKATKEKSKFQFPPLFRIVPIRPKKYPSGKRAKLLAASNTCCPEGCSHVCFIDTDHGRLEVCSCGGSSVIVKCPAGAEA